MTSPATCLVTAAATVCRPGMQSIAAAATATGKRILSTRSSSGAVFAAVRETSSTNPTTTSNNLQSHTSLPLLKDENRRHYSSMSSSAVQTSMLGSGNDKNKNIINNTTTTRRINHQQLLLVSRTFSSASKRDFYEVLGVGKGADKAEIKKSYFKLAKQYHPDTNQNDKNAAEKFKEATEAYEVLSDDKQRQLYDSYGHAGVDPNFGGGQGGGNPFEGFAGFSGFSGGDGSFHFSSSSSQQIDPEELFEAFFGMGGGNGGRRNRNRGPRKGADLQMHVRLSLQEAVMGVKKDLHLRYQIHNKKKNTMEVKERDVTIDVPPGIDNGMNLRLAGQGAEGDPGAPRGNLIVQVLVDEDSYFHRDGMDVHTECPISLTQAVLGGTVDVRTLNGVVEMKIPKGTQVESKLLLRGKGIPHLHTAGKKGNHIVHLKIEIPTKVSKRQEELLREFDEEMKHSGGGIFGRLAKTAGSAFETIFGHHHGEESKSKDEAKKNAKDDDLDDDAEEKKTA